MYTYQTIKWLDGLRQYSNNYLILMSQYLLSIISVIFSYLVTRAVYISQKCVSQLSKFIRIKCNIWFDIIQQHRYYTKLLRKYFSGDK
jgi:hypothetical protein